MMFSQHGPAPVDGKILASTLTATSAVARAVVERQAGQSTLHQLNHKP